MVLEIEGIDNAQKCLQALQNGTITAFGGRFRGASYDKNAERIIKQVKRSLKEAIKRHAKGENINVDKVAVVPSSYYNWGVIIGVKKKREKLYFYLITVAYDGNDFAGKVFSKKINILATSRTDKGVHAREQKFTLRLDLSFSEERLFDLLKKVLGKYILVKKVQRVDNNFHPLRNVVSKEYRYFINTGRLNIWQKKYRWEYNLPLEVKELNRVLQIFQGKHNFFNYSYCRWQEREKTNTEREITSLKTIIGEVINCCEGKQTVNDLQEKLTNFNKKNYKYKNIAPAAGFKIINMENKYLIEVPPKEYCRIM
ncbi:25442_t:CDS:2 [Gigaspora margarita]|uniref:25442_t:CDS:1 n=1 Tax=Gigaspora margarita TaxID=4874 RepID=A0ABN7UPQ0_GIGMA|nr:25442_t:CDS:2 [Gigaspora margarita]